MRGEKQQLTLLTNRISNTSFNTEKGDFAPIPGNDQWKLLSLLIQPTCLGCTTIHIPFSSTYCLLCFILNETKKILQVIWVETANHMKPLL